MSRFFLAALLVLTGCLHTVDECRGIHCPRDGGHVSDAGNDAGSDDDDCPATDPSLTVPCSSALDGGSGIIFDGNACTQGCFAGPIPANAYVYSSLRQCAFFCAFDNCKQSLLSATVTAQATCAALRVTTADAGEVMQSYALTTTDVDGGIGCNLTNGDCVVAIDELLGDAGYHAACAATLLPSTTAVTCDPKSP
ncbi:MAG: hypothetical protein QM723_16665 [Myxococcaceae bacterium]